MNDIDDESYVNPMKYLIIWYLGSPTWARKLRVIKSDL